MVLPISDKIDYKGKLVTRERILYIDKSVDLSRQYKNQKHIHKMVLGGKKHQEFSPN